MQLASSLSSAVQLQTLCEFEASAAAHGAIGNGLADDTEAIQRTIDAAAELVAQGRGVGPSLRSVSDARGATASVRAFCGARC